MKVPLQFLQTVVSLVMAYLLALPLGYERKAHGATGVGLRTVPLVAVGACAYLLMSRYLNEKGVFDTDGVARTLRALMSGLGFIGGGAILKSATRIQGVAGIATGVSVWTAGAIGASVAHGYYQIAVMLSVTCLVAAQLTHWLGGTDEDEDEDDGTPTRRQGGEQR